MDLEKCNILASPISDRFYIGTIKKGKNDKFVLATNKIDRTSQFLAALIERYKDSVCRIKGDQQTEYGLMLLSKKSYEKNKHKRLYEVMNVFK